MNVTLDKICTCGSIGRTDLRQCPEHFHIWRGDKRLASVGRVIRETWPAPETLPPADVLENARIRGQEVDRWFSAYVAGQRPLDLPAGSIRQDSAALLRKLITWFDRQHFKTAESQILVGDDEIGGVLDLRFDGRPMDLKCTYNVEVTHVMQVAAYMDVTDYGRLGAVLHVTERYAEPRVIDLNPGDFDDWQTLRKCWEMIQRRRK